MSERRKCISDAIPIPMPRWIQRTLLFLTIVSILSPALQQEPITASALALISPPTTNTKLSNKSFDPLTPSPQKIPFIVQKLGTTSQPSKSDAVQIADIVISVFFQEEAERSPQNKSKGFITKPLILAYLKNLQYGDVRGKKFMLGSVNNSMFVARQIIPSPQTAAATTSSSGSGSDFVYDDVIDDIDINGIVNNNKNNNKNRQKGGRSIKILEEESKIGTIQGRVYNKSELDGGQAPFGYTYGDILGFVDVTEKNFGLPHEGGDSNSSTNTSTNISSNVENDYANSEEFKGEEEMIRRKSRNTLRPILTNLSVIPKARCSGVGSALVDACENAVMEPLEWSRNYSELVLEVEEENRMAQGFYQKRGYQALFSDPTGRRYDTSGFILANVRTTKICYRKDLTKKRAERYVRSGGDGNGDGGPIGLFFAKLKQVMGM
jgi:GNAT superfamily N-acetyltransferase